MDFPIEINSEKEKKQIITNNNLYYRYYLCTQKIQYIECKKYNNYEEVVKQNDLYLTKSDNEKHTNGVFPVYNFSSVSFKVCKFIPSYFDGLILKYNLYNLLKIKVKK